MQLSAILFLLAVVLVNGQMSVPPCTGGLWISTPQNPAQCSTQQIVVSGGIAPYTISVVCGSNYDTVIAQVQTLQAPGSFSWTVNVQSNTAYAIKVTDCKGNTAFSAARVVEPGPSTCGALLQGAPVQNCLCQEAAPPNPTIVYQPAPVQAPPQTIVQQAPPATATYTQPCYGATPRANGASWADQGNSSKLRRLKRIFLSKRVPDWVDKGIQSQEDIEATSSSPNQRPNHSAYDFRCSGAFPMLNHLSPVLVVVPMVVLSILNF